MKDRQADEGVPIAGDREMAVPAGVVPGGDRGAEPLPRGRKGREHDERQETEGGEPGVAQIDRRGDDLGKARVVLVAGSCRATAKCGDGRRGCAPPIMPSAMMKIGIATRKRTCAERSLTKGMVGPVIAMPCAKVKSASGIHVISTRMPTLRSKAAFDSGCASFRRRSVVAAAPPSVIEKLGPSSAVTIERYPSTNESGAMRR